MNFIDSVISSKNCVLLYPPSISVFNVMAFIIAIPEISTQNIKLITNNHTEVNKNLAAPLDKSYYLNHSDIIPVDSFIIVDKLDNNFKFESILTTSKILILYTIGDFWPDNLNINLKFYKLALHDEGPTLGHKTIEILNTDDKIFKIKKHICSKPGSIVLLSSADNFKVNFGALTSTISAIVESVPRNINGCHFVHVPTYQEYKNILRSTYNRKLYDTNIKEYLCFFYVDINSTDDINKYEQLLATIVEYQTKYRTFLNIADKLMFNETGLIATSDVLN